MSGRSAAELGERDEHRHDRLAIDRPAAADAVEQRRAAQVVEHRAGGRAWITGASRIATSSSTSVRIPPRPTSTAGPNCGSRRRPTISSTPAGAIGSTSRPRTVAPVPAAAARAAPGRPRPQRRRRPAEPNAAELALVGEPDRVELERDRVADGRRAAATAASASTARIVRTVGRPAAPSSSRLSRSDRTRRWIVASRRLRRQAGLERRTTSGRRRAPATGSATDRRAAAPRVGAPSARPRRSP